MSLTVKHVDGAEGARELYERDFYTWVEAQAAALRHRRADALDWENLAEELEALGRNERRALTSHLRVLLIHLLKWRYQPARRTRSWRLTIAEQRLQLGRLLEESPGLKAHFDETLAHAYELARIAAARESRLAAGALPISCPWTFEQVADHNFLPHGPAKSRR